MKKSIKYLAFALLLFVITCDNCFAASEFCDKSGVLQAFKIVGILLFIIKILVPVIIILTGIIGMAKAVIAEDESEVKKCASVLLSKVIIGAIIFFIPTIIYAVLQGVEKVGKTRREFGKCTMCTVNIEQCNVEIKKAKIKENTASP
jgi:hypothetical protein